MKVKTISTQGSLDENCYILEIQGKQLVIDPGSEYPKIKKELKEVLGVLITHHHFDHVGALDELEKEYPVPVYTYENLIEKKYKIGPFSFQVIFTPGHTEDSISFYFPKEKILFTGDFLFRETIGRWDFEGGSFETLQKSIKKIKTYNDDIKVYPGHGPSTYLGWEKQENPYFRN